jgi:hypothetical protein
MSLRIQGTSPVEYNSEALWLEETCFKTQEQFYVVLNIVDFLHVIIVRLLSNP